MRHVGSSLSQTASCDANSAPTYDVLQPVLSSLGLPYGVAECPARDAARRAAQADGTCAESKAVRSTAGTMHGPLPGHSAAAAHGNSL